MKFVNFVFLNVYQNKLNQFQYFNKYSKKKFILDSK